MKVWLVYYIDDRCERRVESIYNTHSAAHSRAEELYEKYDAVWVEEDYVEMEES